MKSGIKDGDRRTNKTRPTCLKEQQKSNDKGNGPYKEGPMCQVG